MSGVTRIGMIGAGGVAARHAENLAALGAHVVAVADPAEAPAHALAARYGARPYADHRAMLDGEDLDAVYVCVPPFAHGDPERDALDAALPLFVEKPLAIDLATAEEIGERVRAAGVPTATGYHWRNLSTLARAQAVLAGAPPRLALAAWLDKVPPVPWWTHRDRSGGQTIEQTTHVLDVLLLLCGEVEEVTAMSSRSPRPAFPDADVDDVSGAVLRFASGAVGTVASTCLLRGKHRAGIELFGEGYALALTEDDLVVDHGEGPEVVTADGLAKRRVDEDFLAAVRGDGDRVRAPYDVALETHRLACAISDAAAARAG
jgi:predicted dehydrogenase